MVSTESTPAGSVPVAGYLIVRDGPAGQPPHTDWFGIAYATVEAAEEALTADPAPDDIPWRVIALVELTDLHPLAPAAVAEVDVSGRTWSAPDANGTVRVSRSRGLPPSPCNADCDHETEAHP